MTNSIYLSIYQYLTYIPLSIYISIGSVASKERQRIIDEFNDSSDNNTGPSICLLTTRGIHSPIYLSIYLSNQTDHIHHPTSSPPSPSDLCTLYMSTTYSLWTGDNSDWS